MEEAKEEVRSRLDIEAVIGEYVQLKRAGRSWKGLSPFTNERTPSFVVSPDKQIWHDFSSNKGGDVFSFIMEVEGIDFRAALELLARKAGVDLSLYQRSNDSGLGRKKQRLLSLLDIAATYYQHSLLKNQHALEYVLKKRVLSKDIVQSFRIGYAPAAERALTSFLKKKGFSESELRDAGVVGSRGNRDMFRGRMMVPLADGQGQVIGFTARIIDDTPGAPKYINTPSTLLYDKSRHVFGLHLAKEAIRKADYTVLVEGNLDVIASHQVGIQQVVATAGTALTEFHLKALARLSSNVRLAFDADAAGIQATERAIPIARTVGVRLSIITLPPPYKDADEAIKADPRIWQNAIDHPQDVIKWLIDQYVVRFDPATVEGKSRIVDVSLPLIVALRSEVQAEEYLQYLAARSRSQITGLQKAYDRARSDSEGKMTDSAKEEVFIPSNSGTYQDSLLGLVAQFPETRGVLKDDVITCLQGAYRQELAHYMTSLDGELPARLPKSLQKLDTYVKILAVRASERYGQWSNQDRYIEAAKLARDSLNEQKRLRKNELIAQLRLAEADGDEKAASTVRTELNKLIKER